MTDKYVRFVTEQKELVTGRNEGFFQAAYSLRRSERLPLPDQKSLEAHLAWFRDFLEALDRFARSLNRHAHGKALSWFKPSANEHILRSREILDILDRNGQRVRMLTTMRPGYVVCEDQIQIAAIPFKDSKF